MGEKILVIRAHVPSPEIDGGARRIVRLMHLMVELGFSVTFVPWRMTSAPGAADRRAEDWQALRAYGIETPDVAESRTWLQANAAGFDAILFNGFEAAEHLLDAVPRTHGRPITIYDTVDLAYLREGRRAWRERDPVLLAHAVNIFRIEMRSVAHAAHSWAISEDERRILKRWLPHASVDVIPSMHPLHPRVNPFEPRRGVLFLGNFQHAPNVDSARYLVQEVMPIVWAQLPGLPVWLVGGYPPASIKALANADVTVTGHVPDLAPIMEQVRVAPAPLRYGAGIKNKIIDSMAYGVPVVTTRLGAEGMPVAQGFNILIADAAAELGAAIVALHEDQSLWERVSHAGMETVATFYSADILQAQLASTFQRYLVGQ